MKRERSNGNGQSTMKRAGNRTERLVIRCTAYEMQQWKNMAEAKGITLSDLVRARLNKRRNTTGQYASQNELVRMVMQVASIERVLRLEITRRGEDNGREPGHDALDEALQSILLMQEMLAKLIL